MKKCFCFILVNLFLLAFLSAQETFHIQNLKNGTHYAYLDINKGKWQIIKKNYANPLQKKILAQGDFHLNPISFYTISSNEKYLLLERESFSIYRHSKQAIYELINLQTQEKMEVFDRKFIREPLFSPNCKKIAFVYNNNIYYQNLETKKVEQITQDGKLNFIINGVPDWVYEEEFQMKRAFQWDETSTKIAYIEFDESKVPAYSLNYYEGENYPTKQEFKYPKAGEQNSKVSVHLYDLEKKESISLDLNSFYKGKDFYIPKLFFNSFSNSLWITTINREQNELKIFDFHLKNKNLKNIFSYKDSHYIKTDELVLDPISKDKFIFASDKDGFNHLYLYSIQGKKIRQITKGSWEIANYYGYDQKNKKIYYRSSQEGSLYLDIYCIAINGKSKKKLSKEKGNNEAYFNNDFSYFIHRYSSSLNPPKYAIVETQKATKIYLPEINNPLEKDLEYLNLSEKYFFEIPASNEGPALDAWMIKPKNFDSTKKYPLLMYVYGGPGSKNVEDKWTRINELWFEILTQKGYVIVAVDGRGTGRKGRKFEKEAIYKNLGNYECIDQIRAAKYLGNIDFINKNRIGIFGWSFGGYLASLAITKGSNIFKSAIAVAPVTHWKFYNTIYTERFMGIPKKNKEAYESSSPLNYIQNLKGNYIIIHGGVDDNVHPQNSFEMINALIRADKKFEMMIYPNNNHGIYGKGARKDIYSRMINFLIEKL